jgi:hypothetical protein
VGKDEGTWVGSADGSSLATTEGLFVAAEPVGPCEGDVLGRLVDGWSVGTLVGLPLGSWDGWSVGASVGRVLGAWDGWSVGTSVGGSMGLADGWSVGASVGRALGLADGWSVGLSVGSEEASKEAWRLGLTEGGSVSPLGPTKDASEGWALDGWLPNSPVGSGVAQ